MAQELRQGLLRLLDTGIEFRYAVAGYIGLGDILKELTELRRSAEVHDKKFNELVLELRDLRERHEDVVKEIRNMREELNSVWRELIDLRADTVGLRTDINLTTPSS